MNALPVMKPYIGGEWIDSESQKFTTIYDPSTGKSIAQVPQCTAAEVEKAVAAAKAAFPAWKNTPVRTRAGIMMKLRGLIERDKEELTRMVATENGKCWSEAAGDVAKALEMTELACAAPSLLMGESLMDTSRGYDTTLYREPIGVFAGIAPWNFPAMIPVAGWRPLPSSAAIPSS